MRLIIFFMVAGRCQISRQGIRWIRIKATGRKRAEYLSGFYREDKLQPVITLVVHFGTEKWDGPLSLHEMMAIKDERLLRFVQDYKIHLIDPVGLTPDELNQFSTSLRKVRVSSSIPGIMERIGRI